jgi:hypothetical protein
MKKIILTSLCVTLFVLGALVGCKTTSFSGSVFQAENLAADAATGATHAFNTYYAQTTNTPAGDTAGLEAARQDIYAADKKMAASLALLENLRTAYDANPAATNQTAVNLALGAVQNQSSNIVALVQLIIANH